LRGRIRKRGRGVIILVLEISSKGKGVEEKNGEKRAFWKLSQGTAVARGPRNRKDYWS
jgi:hypothetical protein